MAALRAAVAARRGARVGHSVDRRARLARDGPLFALLLSYFVLVVAYHPALRIPGLAGKPDYSYGLYVYAFPIQQTVVRLAPDIAPSTLFAPRSSSRWPSPPCRGMRSRHRRCD